MNTWLNPIVRALSERFIPLDLFFVNQDVGWLDDGVFELVDLFADHGMPIDLAVIPEATGPLFAERLLHRLRQGYPVGIHQHGLAHINHERGGSLAEFGPSRSIAQQFVDVSNGRRKLTHLFGQHVDPIFSPPWGRCTPVTGQCALGCGLSTIARHAPAAPIGVDGLAECNTRVDWFAQVDGARLSRHEWARRMARDVAATAQPFGIKVCHAVMDEEDQRAITELLQVVSRHANVKGVLMRDVVQTPARQSVPAH